MESPQPTNRAPLTQFGLKLGFSKIPKVTYFLQENPIPDISLDVVNRGTMVKDYPLPGTKMTYEDLVIKFLVDEDLVSWTEVYNWMVGLGAPESAEQFASLAKNDRDDHITVDPLPKNRIQIPARPIHDATLHLYNSDNVHKWDVEFSDIWPFRLSGIRFATTDRAPEYAVATAHFKYTIYRMRRVG